MFASAILKLPDLPPDPKDERVYDLNPIAQRSFEFIIPTGSGVEQVAVRKLRLTSKIRASDRITLEADPTENRYAIHELMDRLGISLSQYNVTQAEPVALVRTDPTKRLTAMPVRLTWPNSCTLKYDGMDLELRDMLVASGIEPKEPPRPLPKLDAAA
jgi:hypothetical protein